MHFRIHHILVAALVVVPALGIKLPDPLICEDSLDGRPPFKGTLAPCLLGCPRPITKPADIAKYGTYNASDLAPCQLGCVIKNPTSSEVAAAEDCTSKCAKLNSGSPENRGWCMYWCVQGGELASQVVSTSCVPEYKMTPVPGGTTIGTIVYTSLELITMPSQWVAWYSTQTVISRPTQNSLPSQTSSSGIATTTSHDRSTATSISSSPSTQVSTGQTTPAPAADAQSVASSSSPVSTSTRSAAANSYDSAGLTTKTVALLLLASLSLLL